MGIPVRQRRHGGTGSYVNIGKGVGHQPWFKMRVRPVSSTGILSSSQFPEQNQGNFLICNCIGFLGVLQHEVHYNGADITATEIEPILVSSDPNFRPSDVKVGGDGALYVADWSNAIIGHMQHNMRDPNRDHEHGRIYRGVTAKGRPLLKPLKLKGKPIPEVCQAFFAKENSNRYRARLELSGRETQDVVASVVSQSTKTPRMSRSPITLRQLVGMLVGLRGTSRPEFRIAQDCVYRRRAASAGCGHSYARPLGRETIGLGTDAHRRRAR